MNIPNFDKGQVLKLCALIAPYLGPPDMMRKLEANLRAVTDPVEHLRKAADLGPESAGNLVHAAVLGLSVAIALNEVTTYNPPSPGVN